MESSKSERGPTKLVVLDKQRHMDVNNAALHEGELCNHPVGLGLISVSSNFSILRPLHLRPA